MRVGTRGVRRQTLRLLYVNSLRLFEIAYAPHMPSSGTAYQRVQRLALYSPHRRTDALSHLRCPTHRFELRELQSSAEGR